LFDPSHSGPTSPRPGLGRGGIAPIADIAGIAGVIALLLLLALVAAPAAAAAAAEAQAPAAAAPPATSGAGGDQHETENRPGTGPGQAPGGTRLIDQQTFEAAAAGKKIGTVHIVTENIFDPSRPGERRGVFRLVNRLHRTTRPEVIQRQLLFQPGDPYSPETLRESERLLRGNRYLYEASIRTVAEDERKVDLEVLTRDVWTLQLGLDFRRAGGTNSTAFDVEDQNFFGTGKDIEVARLENVDRTSKLVRYRDPSLGNTHGIVDLTFADNSDGDTRALDVERPFYALDTRWAAGVTAVHDVRIDPLYDGGDVVDRFGQRRDFLEVYGGLSPGLLDGVTQRFRLGFTYDRNLFVAAPGFAPPDAAAANRTLAYPWIGYELVEDGFVTVRDFEQIKRTEDVNLGRVLTARLGWSSPVFGGDRSRLILTSDASDGWAFGPRQILLVRADLLGRLSGGRIENGTVSAGVRYYVRTFGNGLRGYPLRYQAGDRRFLVSLEQRFYGSHEYFHLVTLGAAAFFDAGRAWFVEQPPTFLQATGVQRQLLKDVGAGLRLGSSRSATGAVIHLDVAYPLDRNGSIKALQYLVTTSQTF